MERCESNIDSQQMLAFGKPMNKPKTDRDETKQFRVKVAKDEKTLQALLQQRLRQAQKKDTQRRDELASLISNSIKSSTNSTTFPNTTIAMNPAASRASKVSAASDHLQSEFNELEAMLVDLAGKEKETMTKSWEQDMEETERQLRLGHRVALRNVKKVLGAEAAGSCAEAADENMEVDDKLIDQLDYDLLKSLKYAERGVKRMVKGLPKGEENE